MLNKKYLLILFIIIAINNGTFAQTITIRGGLNLTRIRDNPGSNFVCDAGNGNLISIGYHGGLNVNIPIYKKVSFESGLILSRKGYIRDDGEYGDHIKGYENLLYLEMPIAAKFSFNTNSKKPYFFFGSTLPLD